MLKVEKTTDFDKNKNFWVSYFEHDLLQKSRLLCTSALKTPAFVFYAQLIELMGVFYDAKPLRVKEQAKKRFANAIQHLFNDNYLNANNNDWLYYNYRCNMIHSLLPSPFLNLLTQEEADNKGYRHIQKTDSGALVLIMEALQKDIEAAINTIIRQLETGQLKAKETGLLN